MLCVTLSVSLAFIPLDIAIVNSDDNVLVGVDIQRNEAQAFAPVVAGGAAAAGVALGLTEAELAAALAAVFAAGAGIYLYTQTPVDTNGSLTGWPTDKAWPGFEPWDDLTPQEKQDWVGQDGTSDDYWQQQLDIYSMNYGLWEFDQNGTPMPTPEPEDPEDKERWFTKNNVIKVLGTGGAVALGTVASTLTDTAANSLADLLFGKESASNVQPLALQFSQQLQLDHGNINIVYSDVNGVGFSNWFVTFRVDQGGSMDRTCFLIADTNAYPISGVSKYKINTIPIVWNSYYEKYQLTNLQSQNGERNYRYRTGVWNDSYTNGTTLNIGSYGWTDIALNAAFYGRYTFPTSAELDNGAWTNATGLNTNYGQMVDTPSTMANNITNDAAFASNATAVQNSAPEGEKKAVQVPLSFEGSSPSWSDFVKDTIEQDIIPIPNDSPVPNPNPNPNPGGDTEYQEDFGEEVTRLLAQPFDQLFPFCLIGDLKVFTDKVTDAFTHSPSGRRDAPNYDSLVIPLEDFGIEGLENFEFDLLPLKDIGGLVKPWINALLVVALLVGSFRFFLNRGGE